MNEKQTIIAPTNSRADILEYILNQDESVLMGTEIVPLSVYKDNLVSYLENENIEFSKLFKKAQEEIPKTNPYYESLKFPTFFAYFYDFINDLIENGVDVDKLPESEKKEILVWLSKQPLRKKEVQEAFKQIDEEEAKRVKVYDCFYDHKKVADNLDYLISKGAQKLTLETSKNHKATVKYAKNNSQEITSVAQYLIKNKEELSLKDVVLLVNDIDNNYPIVDQILTLYHIPHNINKKSESIATKQFISLLKFLKNKNIETFLDAYNSEAFYFNSTILPEYIDYLSLEYEQLLKPLEYIKNWKNHELVLPLEDGKESRTYEQMLKKEETAEKIMSYIREKLDSLDKGDTLKDKTRNIFNIVKSNLSKRSDEFAALNAIRSLCLDVVPIIDGIEKDEELLIYLLEKIKNSTSSKSEDYLEISDVYKNITNKKLAIIIGCSQDKFPKTINKKGFFDEFYIKDIKDYPSLESRTEYFNEQLERLLESIPEIIFSYSTNDLSGNTLYKSTYLDKYGKEEKWDLVNQKYIDTYEPKLDKETAKTTYTAKEKKIKDASEKYKKQSNKDLIDQKTNDTIIFLSPSAVEKYVECPFKYYLKEIIGEKSDGLYRLKINTLGTIVHESLEKYFDPKRKIPADKTLNEQMEALKELFINKKDYLNMVQNKLLKNIKFKVEYIEDEFKNGKFKAEDFEKEIIHPIHLKGITAIIKGFIDRLDVYEENGKKKYRIVDYKSSKKEIKTYQILNGSKIQLLTYLVALNKELENYIPSEIAYYSTDAERSDYGIKEVIEHNMQVPKEELKKIRNENDKYKNYKSFAFGEEDKNFEEDIDFYTNIIENIYKEVATNILDGNIAIDPKKGACTYCDYKDICHSALDENDGDEADELEQSEGEE